MILFRKFVETMNQGTLRENANRRDTACCQWFVQTVSTAFRGKGGIGREQGQRKRERDEFGMRFAQRVHTRPAQRRGLRGPAVYSTTLVKPPVDAEILQSEEASPKWQKSMATFFPLVYPPGLSFPPIFRVTRRCILHLLVFAHVHPLPTRACGCVYNNINAVECKSCKGKERGYRDCNYILGAIAGTVKRAISERRENKEDRFARADVSTNRLRFRIKNVQFMRSRWTHRAMNPASMATGWSARKPLLFKRKPCVLVIKKITQLSDVPRLLCSFVMQLNYLTISRITL